MTIVTLLTDFGSADSYVAEMKGVLLSAAPKITLVDITHEVPPEDVRAAQYLLSRVWKRFPNGTIHLAVVDPGVGTERRLLAAEQNGHRFLAPDNGLLSFLSPGARFFSLSVPLSASPTFQGRDVLAPAAVAIANGASLESLGSVVTHPHHVPLPSPRIKGATVTGEVIYVDRYGTLISNIPEAALSPGMRFRAGGNEIGSLRRTYADVPRGTLVVMIGSGGTVEVAVRDGSAAGLLGIGVGAEVRGERK